MYNQESCSSCFGCRVIFSGRQRKQLYNKQSCLRCFGCRVIFLGRQREQLVQPRKLSPLFWLSCYIFRTTTGTTYTTKKVVSVVLVVVYIFGRQQEQLIQQSMWSPLFWLSCYIFRTTTGTTYTTSKVVLVVLVVVLYFLDDNGNNLYNKESCSCCFGCRVIYLRRQRE